jgi:hypothetical protein
MTRSTGAVCSRARRPAWQASATGPACAACLLVQAEAEEFDPTLNAGQVQHHLILEAIEAIEAGDSALAEQFAREHADLARQNFEVALREGESLESFPGGSLINVRIAN